MAQRTLPLFLTVIFLCVSPLVGCAATAPQAATPQQSSGEMARYRQNSDATYRIDFTNAEGYGHGTGVVISSEGHILTAYHVVSHADSLSVMISENGYPPKTYPVKVICADVIHDIAVVKVDRRFLSPAILEDERNVHPGDDVYNIGYPYDYGEMVARGHIMRLHYSPIEKVDEKLPADERVYIREMTLADFITGPGASGSGIFLSSSGKLIGVMRLLIWQGTGNIRMMTRAFVPVDQVVELLKTNRIPYVSSNGTVAAYAPLPRPSAPTSLPTSPHKK